MCALICRQVIYYACTRTGNTRIRITRGRGPEISPTYQPLLMKLIQHLHELLGLGDLEAARLCEKKKSEQIGDFTAVWAASNSFSWRLCCYKLPVEVGLVALPVAYILKRKLVVVSPRRIHASSFKGVWKPRRGLWVGLWVNVYVSVRLHVWRSLVSYLGPQIIKSDLNHSTLTPTVAPGTNQTLWQVFSSDRNFTGEPYWRRLPYDLSNSTGHFYHVWMDSGTGTFYINATITIFDAASNPDGGRYTVTVSNGCTSNTSYFDVIVPDCDITTTPEPDKLFKVLNVPEPQQPTDLTYNVTFNGWNAEIDYSVHVLRSGTELCSDSESSNSNPHYSCYRNTTQFYGQCIFLFTFQIHNYSHEDSDTYYIRVDPAVKTPQPGNDSVLQLSKYSLLINSVMWLWDHHANHIMWTPSLSQILFNGLWWLINL